MSWFHEMLTMAQTSGPILFLNGGQSLDEKSVLLANIDLTAPYQVPFPEVQYRSDAGTWLTMDYSDQDSFQSPLLVGTQAYANQFYLYPQLAAALGCDASFPLYVCSHSVGDTSLEDDWNPVTGPGALFTAMISRCQAAIADLTATYGVPPIIPLFLWDQGQKDGRVLADANQYGTNWANFKFQVRTQLGYPNLRFLTPLMNMGSINGSPNPVTFGYIVNNALADAATADPTRQITQDCNFFEPYTDGVHLTVLGQSDKNNNQMNRFADAGWITGTPSPTPPAGQTYFNGYSNYVRFGDILDSTFAAANGNFRLKLTIWNPPKYGSRTLVSKFATTGNQRCFHWLINNVATIGFNYYMNVGTGAQVRGIQWTQPATLRDGSEHSLEIRYDGSIATGAGLDRVSLYYDGVLYTTGKTLVTNAGALTNTLFNSTASLAVGGIAVSAGSLDSYNFIIGGWARAFEVENSAGTDLINVPNLATGTDTSGNGNNGIYTRG